MNESAALSLNRFQREGFSSGIPKNKEGLTQIGYVEFKEDLDVLRQNHYSLLDALSREDNSLISVDKVYSVARSLDDGKGIQDFSLKGNLLEEMLFNYLFLSGYCKVTYRKYVWDFASLLAVYPKLSAERAVKLLPQFCITEGNGNGIVGTTIYLTKEDSVGVNKGSIKKALVSLIEKVKLLFLFTKPLKLNVIALPFMHFLSEPVFLYLMDLAYSFGITYTELCQLYGVNVPDQENALLNTGYCIYLTDKDCFFIGNGNNWTVQRSSADEFVALMSAPDSNAAQNREGLNEVCCF